MATLAGSLSAVEDLRPVHRQPDLHPYHQHPLVKISATSRGVWRCQLCIRTFDPMAAGAEQAVRAPVLAPALPCLEDPPLDVSVIHHCPLCSFDMCAQCFQGFLHPFHGHRLRMAKPSLVYSDTDGQWRCDACHTVFTALTNDTMYHCDKCETDLCGTCFNGQQRHSLHNKHFLNPVDPRILYRTNLSWTCDNCTETFTATTNKVFFHCPLCQFDLCEQCFHGDKHHLHQHRLTPLSLSKQLSLCSNCRRQQSAYQCTECGYSLCRACHMTSAKPNTLHAHPLELCDAKVVYPQSGGLWHCDNCTRHSPNGHQTPLPPHQPMYHCQDCNYDLCEPCYTTGRNQTPLYELPNRPTLYNPSHNSYGPAHVHYNPSNNTRTLCLICAQRPATTSFVHGQNTCTVVAIVCEDCAREVLMYRRPCPYCKEVPDRTKTVN